MLNHVLLYLTTVTAFLVVDGIGIKLLIRPVFERHIGHLFADPIRILPAVVFYLVYVMGLLWFVSIPALKAAAPLQALCGGMILGLLCYGTYEFTNYATLRDWSLQQVIVDGLWGITLTGFAAWVGVAVMSGKLS